MEQSAGDRRGGSRSGVHIELDPEKAARLKAERDRRLHTTIIPALRLTGFVFFAASVGLHNWLILDDVSWRAVAWFLVVVVVYSLLSWLVLALFFGRTGGLHLGDVFLVVDILFLVMAVYLSGGEHSWIFFILLGRVADQAVGGFRRTVVFAHLCVLGFVLMLAWIVVVDGRTLALWPTVAKSVFFYMGGWYMALCSLPVERRRRSTSAAVRAARQLIGRLNLATEALVTSRLQAEAASEAKGQFLATMSHEVRTPLSAVIGMAELLKDTRLDETQKEYLGHLREGADTTLRLMQDVLDVADLDRSSVDLEHVAFAPAAALHGIVREYRPAAEAKGIELVAEEGKDLPNAILGDRRRTRQLLRLLVDNAVKFTDEGRVVVSCELGSGEPSDPRLRWTVCDTGIGFEAGELPRLLETFVQADPSDTRRFGGAGLGLALARRLAEAMGGVLEATSTPGGGSTFWVEYPVQLET